MERVCANEGDCATLVLFCSFVQLVGRSLNCMSVCTDCTGFQMRCPVACVRHKDVQVIVVWLTSVGDVYEVLYRHCSYVLGLHVVQICSCSYVVCVCVVRFQVF